MRRAHILLTDSGGIQEEAPSLGKPVLVMREKTERPEAGRGRHGEVGRHRYRVESVRECMALLENPAEYERVALLENPYGDGHAAERIRDLLARGTKALPSR